MGFLANSWNVSSPVFWGLTSQVDWSRSRSKGLDPKRPDWTRLPNTTCHCKCSSAACAPWHVGSRVPMWLAHCVRLFQGFQCDLHTTTCLALAYLRQSFFLTVQIFWLWLIEGRLSDSVQNFWLWLI